MSGEAMRFARFLAVGALNAVFGLGLYWLLVWVGLGPQRALAISFGLGVLWNFQTHGRLVFGTAGLRKLGPYILSYLFIYMVNALALHGLLSAGVGSYKAQALLVPMTALMSYGLISCVLTGHLPFAARGRD